MAHTTDSCGTQPARLLATVAVFLIFRFLHRIDSCVTHELRNVECGSIKIHISYISITANLREGLNWNSS